jgi:hypothetical protein
MAIRHAGAQPNAVECLEAAQAAGVQRVRIGNVHLLT